ncbi:MAG: AIR synthase related protein [Candidatus Scalindua sp.]
MAGVSYKEAGVNIEAKGKFTNDILVLGAEPLFFLDYMASSRMIHEKMKEVLHGIANGCCEAECALLGGETPEIFGVIQEKGKIDENEMYHVFNIGIGMVLIVSKHFSSSIMKKLKRMKEDAFIIGKVVRGNKKVEIV